MIIDRLWRMQPGKYFCISTKSAGGKWKDNYFRRDELGEVDAFIKSQSDKDIYFCPQGLDEKSRVKECCVKPKVMWSDLDAIDPRGLKLKPSVAFESSPGRYVGLWLVDGEVEEKLNRRLSYMIGADNTGWDWSQVLRVPGTTNYKYTTMPKTRILWADGPEYNVGELRRMLPRVKDEADDGVGGGDVEKVYQRWEKKFPAWIRRELLAGRPTVGKRSEMIWKLNNTLLELGVSRGDAFTLLRASPWNKFVGRDRQLKKELERSVRKHMSMNGKANGHAKDDGYTWLARSLDEVERENIDWIWYPYLARGELTILEGNPNEGKSYAAQMISGAICDGRKLPCEREGEAVVRGTVAYFDIENSSGSVTKVRMQCNNVRELGSFYQEEMIFSIDDEERMAKVYEALERVRPALVVFDTINTYLGKADAFKGHEAQQAFIKFKEIAKRFKCAVMVLRHLTKSSKEQALYRGQGNIALTGVARVVLTVGHRKEEPDIGVIAVTKLNIARRPRALTYKIVGLPDRGGEKDRSKFSWEGFIDATSDEIIMAPDLNSEVGKLDGCVAFLHDILKDGAVSADKVRRMSEARSISSITLRRASEKMDIKRKITGFGKERQSTWSLPQSS